MKQYLDLLNEILNNGEEKPNRTGVNTISVFPYHMRFDLREGFPILTTKKVPFRLMVAERLWFNSGSTNMYDLPEYVQHWWASWADKDGWVGDIYGKQMRRADGQSSVFGIDQLQRVVNFLREDPNSRRHIISLWHPHDMAMLKKPHLPCCHGTVTQFYVGKGRLHCATYQRSADVPIGLPVNIASYALLVHIIAHQVGLDVGVLDYTTGDTHIYVDQIEGAEEQLSRTPLKLPKLEVLRTPARVDGYEVEDFKLVGYEHYPTIKFPVAV